MIKRILKYLDRLFSTTKTFINKFNSSIQLFHQFLMDTDEKQLQQWSLRDDKNLYVKGIEILINFSLRYLFVGLWITLALVINGTFGVYLKCTVGYWLLSNVLLKAIRKE